MLEYCTLLLVGEVRWPHGGFQNPVLLWQHKSFRTYSRVEGGNTHYSLRNYSRDPPRGPHSPRFQNNARD